MERRQVSTLGLLWRHQLWVPLIPAVVAVVLLSVAAARFATADLLERHGITVRGQVIEQQIIRRRTQDGANSADHYLIYSFRTLAGEEGRGRGAVSVSRFNSSPIGTPLDVTYAEVDPTVSTLDPGAPRLSALAFALGGAVAGIGAGVLGWVMWRQKRSALRAARRGEVRQARVRALSPGSLRVRGEQYYQMDWIDAAGQSGQSRNHPLARLPERDAVIVVYVDPETGRGWWENDL